jgi:phage recombination protein Bet
MARPGASTSTAVAIQLLKPPDFTGTPTQWRVLTETIWPAAKSAESIMLALGYCAARKLDPFKRPVHIVPMWNSRLRREVETVWPGINELLTTAARSNSFAGVDPPELGPDETRTFEGVEHDDRTNASRKVSVTVTFPVWCSVRVWRHVNGERRAFSQPVYWIEAYRRRGFRSEVPNAMWEQRPRGQLHKCALAAALRLGFPEDLGSEYAAEEMEGGELDSGGVVIDGKAEGSATTTQRDKQADEAFPPPEDDPGNLRLALLDEPNGTVWLKHLHGLLDAATNADQVVQIACHRSVHATLAAESKLPPMLREQITDALAKAHERFKPAADEGTDTADTDTSTGTDQTWDDDPMQELLLEVEQMDAISLASLATNATWRGRVHEAAQIPQDEDRVREAIEARRLALKGGGKQ